MSTPRTPVSAYRLQFNAEFTFRQAREILPYLHELGITDLYASPLLQSRRGSGHGYDVTDPTRIDGELGSEEEFEALHSELRKLDMGLVLDIVPNHMAADTENSWWMDVLENGPGSAYASYFDIDWHPPSRTLDNKLLLPVLGAPYGQTLENRELSLTFSNGRFLVKYYDAFFPVSPRSYRLILKHRLDALESALGKDSAPYQEYQGILAALSSLPERESLAMEAAGERRLQVEAVKERLRQLCGAAPEVQKFIDENVHLFNGRKGDATSFRLLDRLLTDQAYVLAYWQNTNEAINYRRFFTISDLVGVRVEDPVVFEATHGVILRLVGKGAASGLRIDHIDGLRDPLGYLRRLEERLGSGQPESNPGGNLYIVVEKILSGREELPEEWPVQGTTGYDFLNHLTRLFVNPRAAKAVERIYQDFIGAPVEYDDVAYQKKKLVMATLLAVEMRALSRQLGVLAEQDRYARDLSRVELGQALVETTASFPRYRTYIRSLELTRDERGCIESAIAAARHRRPNMNPACFDFVQNVLLLTDQGHLFPDQREARLAFVMRWQQFTGPIIAKGIEDTALYVYNPLISLNEVGGDPRPQAMPVDDFHGYVKSRQRRWPYSLNTTSTHDTKRAEDVRARINVLSEIPKDWQRNLRRWAQINAPKKDLVKGKPVPDHDEEIFLYQTLLGAWPLDPRERPDFEERLQAYLVKATREAMVHTRWTLPNLDHEGALKHFARAILEPGPGNQFLDEFAKFQRVVAYYGMLNGLAQVLLKVTCPGVPDVYKGSELWDFRLVDPDNRGPVDFTRRMSLLEDIKIEDAASPQAPERVRALLENWCDGRIKLYVIWKALNFRRRNRALLLDGSYTAVKADGKREQNAFAFVRRRKGQWMLVAVPRWLAATRAPMTPSRMGSYWGASRLVLPAKAPAEWTNVLTGENVRCAGEHPSRVLPLRDLFRSLPVALLTSGSAGDEASEPSQPPP
jgi:(1->4)-alpha-D-glucan 1-alpha-D-glucosylmutase